MIVQNFTEKLLYTLKTRFIKEIMKWNKNIFWDVQSKEHEKVSPKSAPKVILTSYMNHVAILKSCP